MCVSFTRGERPVGVSQPGQQQISVSTSGFSVSVIVFQPAEQQRQSQRSQQDVWISGPGQQQQFC
jgi:hypothetical protein